MAFFFCGVKGIKGIDGETVLACRRSVIGVRGTTWSGTY